MGSDSSDSFTQSAFSSVLVTYGCAKHSALLSKEVTRLLNLENHCLLSKIYFPSLSEHP
jgi:hypothetical protein